jgi:SAM-dependent methyltransferase
MASRTDPPCGPRPVTRVPQPGLFLEHQLPILATAERSEDAGAALRALRPLGLDDFALFLWMLPNSEYPNLSRLLPRMAPVDVQVGWNGESGLPLLSRSLSVIRHLESAAIRYTGSSLTGRRILDFGCGYGRLIRLLYFYTDPENIVGVDAWRQSLEFCRNDGVLGTLLKSDDVPTALPVKDVEIAFSHSVLTHLSEKAALAVLAAVRATLRVGGLFVCTIRPIEFWRYVDGVKDLGVAEEMEARHRSVGFAFHPLNSPTFGESSIAIPYLARLHEWELLACERLLDNPYSVVIGLRAR